MARFPANAEEITKELLTEVMQELQPGIEVTAFEIVNLEQCGDGLASTADRIILKLQYGGTIERNMPEQVMLKPCCYLPMRRERCTKTKYVSIVRFARS